MLRLILMNGDERGMHFDVPDDPPRLIGRNALGTKVADRRMSRNHAEVFKKGGLWLLRDLGSSNGTFVNGEKVEKLARLKTGDRIQCGRTRLQVGYIEGEAGGDGGAPEETLTGEASEAPEAGEADAGATGIAVAAPPAEDAPEPVEEAGGDDLWGEVIGGPRPSGAGGGKHRKRPAEPVQAGGFDEQAFDAAFGLGDDDEDWDVLDAGEPAAGPGEDAEDPEAEAGAGGIGLLATLGGAEAPPEDEPARVFEPEDVAVIDAAAEAPAASAAAEADAPEEDWDAGFADADAAAGGSDAGASVLEGVRSAEPGADDDSPGFEVLEDAPDPEEPTPDPDALPEPETPDAEPGPALPERASPPAARGADRKLPLALLLLVSGLVVSLLLAAGGWVGVNNGWFGGDTLRAQAPPAGGAEAPPSELPEPPEPVAAQPVEVARVRPPAPPAPQPLPQEEPAPAATEAPEPEPEAATPEARDDRRFASLLSDGPSLTLGGRPAAAAPSAGTRVGSAADLQALISAAQGRGRGGSEEPAADPAPAPEPEPESAPEPEPAPEPVVTPTPAEAPTSAPAPGEAEALAAALEASATPRVSSAPPGGGLDVPAPPPEVLNPAEPADAGVAEAAAPGGDVAFLVDASGSMVDSMPQARRWLRDAIGRLDPPSRFTVLRLGHDGVTACFDAPRPANAAAREAALAWADDALASPYGRADPAAGLALAGALGVDRVVVLADDTFGGRRAQADPAAVEAELRSALGPRTDLLGVQFNYPAPDGLLARLGRGDRGRYVFVEPVNDLDPGFDASILLP